MVIAKKTSTAKSASTPKAANIGESATKKTTRKSTTSTTNKDMATKSKTADSKAEVEVKELNSDQEKQINYWESNKSPVYFVDFATLKLDYNIRNDATDISDLVETIGSQGVVTPITVDLGDRIIDGYRRYNALKHFETKGTLDERFRMVPVQAIDIKEEDVPHYQFLTMIRKGINAQEEENAIYEHIRRNPNQTESKVAALFGKSQTMVHMIGSILRESPELSDLVKNKKASQNLATDLVDKNYLEQLPAKQEGKKAALDIAADLIEQFYDEKVVNTIDSYKKKNPDKATLSDDEILENVTVHPITSKEFNKFLISQPKQDIPILTKFKSSPATSKAVAPAATTDDVKEQDAKPNRNIEFDLKGYGNTIASALPALLASPITVNEVGDLVQVTVSPEIIAVLCIKMSIEIPETVLSLLKPKVKKETVSQVKPKQEEVEEDSLLINYARELKGSEIDDDLDAEFAEEEINSKIYEDVNAVPPLTAESIAHLESEPDLEEFLPNDDIEIVNPIPVAAKASTQTSSVRTPFSLNKTQLQPDEMENGDYTTAADDFF